MATPSPAGNDRKVGAPVSSPAHAVREGDPLTDVELWIPFPSAFAPAGNDTEGEAMRSAPPCHPRWQSAVIPGERQRGKGIHSQADGTSPQEGENAPASQNDEPMHDEPDSKGARTLKALNESFLDQTSKRENSGFRARYSLRNASTRGA